MSRPSLSRFPATKGGAAALLALALAPGGAAVGKARLDPPAGGGAPVVWQLCPDTEVGALVPLPPGDSTPGAVLHLSHPLAGSRMSAEVVHGSLGGDRLLVRLKAPAGARPGHYEGVLTVRRGPAVVRRPADVQVLPFELMRPSKQYAVTRVPVTTVEWGAPEDASVDQLRQLRDLGVGALCLSAPPADRAVTETTMRAAGLHGPVLEPLASTRARRLPPEGPATSIALDQPSFTAPIHWYAFWTGKPPSADVRAALRSRGIMLAGPAGADGGTDEVDLPLFDAAGAASTHLLDRTGAAGPGTAGWWRWDAGAASPLENRLRSGAWLWKSGLSGALLEISPDAPASAGWALQWEGVRDGILDSRYLTTLYSLIRQVKDKDRGSRLPGQAEAAINRQLSVLAEQPSPAAADHLRSLAIAWILRLGGVVWSG